MVCRFTFFLLLAVLISLVVSDRYQPTTACPTPDVRTFDGTCNNLNNPQWGSKNITFVKGPDGTWFVDNVAAYDRLPNERVVSNVLFAERPYYKKPINYTFVERKFNLSPDPFKRNNLFVMFGQFLFHDFARADVRFRTAPSEVLRNFAVTITDTTDPLYEAVPHDPSSCNTPRCLFGYPRRYILTMDSQGTIENGSFVGFNLNTAFMDGSVVYGSDAYTASRLRSFVNGKMLVDSSNLLPTATERQTESQCGQFGGLANAAGDSRADENPVLEALHVIFVREHNRLCDEIIADRNSKGKSYTDEEVFQEARNWVTAYLQHLLFDEYMPLLIGNEWNQEIGEYQGYDDTANPSMTNAAEFVASRIPHDQVNFPLLIITDENCNIEPSPGTLPGFPEQERANCLKDFSGPRGVEPFLKGALIQHAQSFDHTITDSMRNIFSKVDTPFGNFDVEVSNIHRNRRHGIPSYYTLRKRYTGQDLYAKHDCQRNALATEDPLTCFLHITTNLTLAADLKALYKKIDQIDAFVGVIVESTRTSMGFPVTASRIMVEQMRNMRDGDRWWYENTHNKLFKTQDLRKIKDLKLADIIRRNTNLPYVPNKSLLAQDGQEELPEVHLCPLL